MSPKCAKSFPPPSPLTITVPSIHPSTNAPYFSQYNPCISIGMHNERHNRQYTQSDQSRKRGRILFWIHTEPLNGAVFRHGKKLHRIIQSVSEQQRANNIKAGTENALNQKVGNVERNQPERAQPGGARAAGATTCCIVIRGLTAAFRFAVVFREFSSVRCDCCVVATSLFLLLRGNGVVQKGLHLRRHCYWYRAVTSNSTR